MVEPFPGLKGNTRRFGVPYDGGLAAGYQWYDAERKEPLFSPRQPPIRIARCSRFRTVASDAFTTGRVILQVYNSNSGRREIVANCQNRFVPLRSQSVHGAVSEIQSRTMAHAFPKSPECGDGPFRLRLIERSNLTSHSVDQFIQERRRCLSGTRPKDNSSFQ